MRHILWVNDRKVRHKTINVGIDWDMLVGDIQFIAMDESGIWSGYEGEPRLNHELGEWATTGDVTRYSLRALALDKVVDRRKWEHSLLPRGCTELDIPYVIELNQRYWVDIPWDALRESVQWVAMDKDGTWWGYSAEPRYEDTLWKSNEDDRLYVHNLSAVHIETNLFRGHARFALARRPTSERRAEQ